MGWTYNTLDPDAVTIAPRIVGVAVALTFISLIFVCLRLYVRVWLIKATGYDDWITVVTWLMAASFSIISIIQTKWGLGIKHAEDFPEEDLLNFGILQFIGAPFYILSILGFKLALLISYLRFLPMGNYRNGTKVAIMACTLFHLCFLIIQINFCQPVAKQWDPTIKGGSCLPAVPVYTTLASITIVFDVIVLLIPFPALLESHIQNRKKFVLLGLFGLGLFITVIQLVRIQTIRRLVNPVDTAPLILWSTVENNLGVIIAVIPTLGPLVKYFNENANLGEGSIIFGGGGRTKSGSGGGRKSRKERKEEKRHSRKGSFPLDSGKFDGDEETSDTTSHGGSFEMKRNIHSKELILGPMVVMPGPGTGGHHGGKNKKDTGDEPAPADGVITMKTEVVVTYD
ncbi:Satratoxin biosynthesis SC1 cluster protein 4 [Naviculisporaceae sp. PSN 640]